MSAQGSHSIQPDIWNVKKRVPPISKNHPGQTSAGSTPSTPEFPVVVYHGSHSVRPIQSPAEYLTLDLETPRLNAIHQHLWLAGRPTSARPLHRQQLLGRTVLITEDPDEHLVWHESQIFIKPLQEYLLNYDFWTKHLCEHRTLYKCASGMLLSYAWLVSYKSDLAIAHEIGLLPKAITWQKWTQFLNTFLDNVDTVNLDNVSKRYRYGELRLSRLNTIYRLLPPTYSLRNLVRGYTTGSTWYEAFFGRHFRWTLVLFAVLSVLLSALQVGLATELLQDDRGFQRASYGFTIVALIAVVASAVAMLGVWWALFWYHLASAWWYNRAVELKKKLNVAPARFD